MKDKRKIVLGKKDVFPYKNTDNYINVEIFRTSDEIVNEVIENNFNLLEQFYNERQSSLKFCVYGILNSIYTDTQNVEIKIKTNHDDIITTPRIGQSSFSSKVHTINSSSFSQNSTLSKNVFNKNKSMFYFLFELSPFYNNQGETKSLILSINDSNRKLFLNQEIPFLFFDSEKKQIPYGTETVDYSSTGDEQIVRNDFPFFYDTHWIKSYVNINRPRRVSFIRNLDEELDNDTVLESIGNYKFTIKLDEPSFYGIEEAEVFILEEDTERGSGKDYKFKNQIIKWEKGEQYKTVEIEIIDDLFVEQDSYILFGIRNLKFVDNDISNQTFKLNILDNDKPIPLGFTNNSNTVNENDGQILIELFLENPTPVPNQTIDVVLVKNNKIIIGEPEVVNPNKIIFEQLKESPNFEVFKRGFEVGIEQGDTPVQMRVKLSKLPFYLQYPPIGRTFFINKDIDIIISQNVDLQSVFNIETDETLIETTAIIGKDFEPSEVIDEELLYQKTIQLPPGIQFVNFYLNLLDDFDYEVDKNIVLKLSNPTPNIIIDKSRDTFILTIKDSLVPRYTRYKILSENSQENNGIFVPSLPISPNSIEPIIMIRTDNLIGGNQQSFLTNNFPLNISIKNKGVPIVYENKLVEKDEFFILNQTTFSNQDIIFDLPTNADLNEEKRQYTKSLYEFHFEIDINRFSEITSNPINLALLKSIYNSEIFRTIICSAELLDSSEKKGEKEYFLVTEVENVISKLRENTEYDVYLRAKQAGVNKDETFQQIFDKIKVLSFYLQFPSFVRTNRINQDVQIIFNENLDWQNIDLNDLSFKYNCGNFNQFDFLVNKTNVKFNGTLFLPKNDLVESLSSSGFFSNNPLFDVPKLLNVNFKESPILDFCSIQNTSQNLIPNPFFTPPPSNFHISVEPLN
jgi:hypothetical protein